VSRFPGFWSKLIGAIFLCSLVTACGKQNDQSARTSPATPAVPDVAAEAREALKNCDQLASDPSDPGRWAAGVPDAQMAPGAAIEACQHAVQLNPQTSRANYELGRSLWAAHRDADAWKAFMASSDYGPTLKYIGDAYFYGRGLPTGEVQNANTALIWYKRSAAKAYDEANKAIDITQELIEKNTFNESYFQNGPYMAALYNGDARGIEMPISLITYTKAVVGELNSDKILFIDSSCAPLATYVGGVALDLAESASYLTMLNGGKSFQNGLKSMLSSEAVEDQGRKDAVALINHYGCKSPVVKQIADHIVLNYNELDKMTGSGGNQGSTDTTPAPQNPPAEIH